MSENSNLSPEIESAVEQLVQRSVDKMKAELVAYIDKKFEIASFASGSDRSAPTEDEEDPVTLNMIMLQIAAVFEKFGHYDEIYRTYGIEADAFQDECNESLDAMHYQVEQFESQLKDFQNRLHIEESGGESAIRHNSELQSKFEALSKEVQETLGQFDQYFDAQLKQLESLPDEVNKLKEALDKKQGKSEALIKLQESRSELLGKIRTAVEELNKQLPLVVSAQFEKHQQEKD